MTGSPSRRQKRAAARAQKASGVAVVARTRVPAQVNPTEISGAVRVALQLLVDQGADLESRIAITIGDDHPDYPATTIVEAKAARRAHR